MKAVVSRAAVVAFVLCVPLLAYSSSALSFVFDAEFFAQGQRQQQVEAVAGLPPRVLAPVNRGIVRYFGSRTETLAESLVAEGADGAFFNARETTHMTDVRGLVHLVELLQRISLAYGIMYLVVSVPLVGTRAVGRLGLLLVAGGVLGVALIALVGVLALVDFGGLFLRFHLLSFTNDFWMLDPRTDRLIQMFPFGFWYDAMLGIVGRSLLVTVSTAAAGAGLVWLGRRLL